MTNHYECAICLTLNSSRRFQCQNCGTIPAAYSVIRKPSRLIGHGGMMQFIEVTVAFGAVHSCRHHSARLYLRTVSHDYYGE